MDRLESAAELRASIDAEMAMFRRDAEKSSQGEPQSADAKRRRLSNEMVEDIAGRWEKVLALMKESGASAAMLDEARARSSEDIAWLMAERKRREAPAGDEGTRGLDRGVTGLVLAGALLVSARDLPALREDEIQAWLQQSIPLAKRNCAQWRGRTSRRSSRRVPARGEH
ncbi:hypothetical protein [Mesorhizobium sp. CAU 1732]|uniref:hypothetical protein n=1 Tax=Mesorhizobium sp. CAU 1732 TaxID=3140358 RepID=UPI00326051A4